MKITNRFVLSLLVSLFAGSSAYGILDDWNHTDPKYSNVQYSNVDGNVTFTVTDGENLSDFDMYYHTSDSGYMGDNGVLLGGAASYETKPVYGAYKDNADVKSVTINLEDSAEGEGFKTVVGMGFIGHRVTGPVNINITGGHHGIIVGGVQYPSGINANGKDGSNFGLYSPDHDITIKMTGGQVIQIIGGNAGSKEKVDNYMNANPGVSNPSVIGGDISIEVSGGTVDALSSDGPGDAIVTSDYGHGVDGNVSVKISGKDTVIHGNVIGGARWVRGYVNGSSTITIEEGTINGNVYAGGNMGKPKRKDTDSNPQAGGDIILKMTGGTVNGDLYGAGQQVDVAEDTTVSVELTGGTVDGNVYGAGKDCSVGGDVVVKIDGADVKKNVYAAGENSTVKGNSTVKLLSGNVGGVLSALGVGSTVEGEAGAVIEIGSAEQAYVGSVGSIEGFDQMVVSEGSRVNMTNANLFDTLEHTYTLSAANLKKAAVTLGGQSTVSVDSTAPITLNFGAAGPLKSGRYKVIDATAADVDTSNWNKQNVTVNGVDGFSATFEDLKWVDNVLYFIIKGQDVTNTMAANWGVFKSSQAFVNTLWGNRSNCVVIKPVYDGKNSIRPSGQTVAWGTVYGQSGRISGVGADYELFGASVGAEHTFKTGRSIGAAFGYDWGTVSPFSCSDIDQESMHLALYGRAGAWKAGQNGTIVLDWSAAYGNTTSETDAVSGDWDQNNIQLDARVSYQRQLRERTVGSVFAGLQYFAAEDSSVDGIGISSMQNVRAEVGVGVSHKATQKTTVYGEVSVYNDVMRHNPNAVADGETFYGTNPGRVGGTITAGAEYRLNEDWSLRGSYNFEVADDSVEHNINAGAIYKF